MDILEITFQLMIFSQVSYYFCTQSVTSKFHLKEKKLHAQREKLSEQFSQLITGFVFPKIFFYN